MPVAMPIANIRVSCPRTHSPRRVSTSFQASRQPARGPRARSSGRSAAAVRARRARRTRASAASRARRPCLGTVKPGLDHLAGSGSAARLKCSPRHRSAPCRLVSSAVAGDRRAHRGLRRGTPGRDRRELVGLAERRRSTSRETRGSRRAGGTRVDDEDRGAAAQRRAARIQPTNGSRPRRAAPRGTA